jgi:excinuclease ABC subunit A
MSKSSVRSAIRLRGVRHNNLKNFDLDLPLNQLIVITGLSGSGKSSLAFDTLFAEGQRRYIETFSPYARQFFDRMDKPQVDSIEGIPPAIAIEQRNAVKTTRSTVGTMTEITDYMKLLWPHIAQLHCRQCGQLVRKDSPQQIWQAVNGEWRMTNGGSAPEVLITFELPLAEKISLEESLALVSRQGYQRLLVNGEMVRVEAAAGRIRDSSSVIRHLTVLQDRVKLAAGNRARFVEACEQAYHFGKGKLTLHFTDAERGTRSAQPFSNRLHCAKCDIDYREPTPALFSFNHPVGACPTCKGFGRVISIDYDLAIPDRSRTLKEGVVKPWLTGHGLESHNDLMRTCRHFEIPTDVPFEKLPKKWQEFVINGEPDHGKDEEHEWPRSWYGVKGYFRWLESKAYKMHVRVLLSRYRAYTTCPECHGARFQPETLLYRVAPSRDRASLASNLTESEPPQVGCHELTLADFYQLPIRDALAFVDHFAEAKQFKANDPIGLVFSEVRSRLGFLSDVGLSYLTLDRATRSLSGGETERVNLTTCLGTRLVNTLFVLDEPSVGLHPRDTERLVRILEQLRNAGNTVVVVEHEASVMSAADQIIDLGPGHGAAGGEIVFQGTYRDILKAADSLTGQYLSGRKEIEVPERRAVVVGQASRLSPYANKENLESHGFALNDAPEKNGDRPVLRSKATAEGGQDACPTLKLCRATRHNLKDVSIEIPLGRLVCVTGVSGSGKTTLIREVLLPALEAKLRTQLANLKFAAKASERIEGEDVDNETSEARNTEHGTSLAGFENLARVVLVDQSILGKTPRSNPAVYIGAFDDIREVFAQCEVAKQRGLNASAFSFNSAQGQCERCRGAGFEKIEMQFLSDVFIRCPECDGRRYRPHIIEVKVPGTANEWSIADMLEATVDEAIQFLCDFPDSRPAVRAVEGLKLLQEVGLGYLRLGQPINTLSGGESQRLKLVRHLAEAAQRGPRVSDLRRGKTEDGERQDACPTLFLFDEPTTGLHFDDVRVLLKVFQRLVDAGHSVIVIEHNLEVIKSADWVIDLGPGAGDEGGRIVAEGTPEEIAACEASPTGKFLRDLLNTRSSASRFPDKNGGPRETRYPKLTGAAH